MGIQRRHHRIELLVSHKDEAERFVTPCNVFPRSFESDLLNLMVPHGEEVSLVASTLFIGLDQEALLG